jgi:hypothetical protein
MNERSRNRQLAYAVALNKDSTDATLAALEQPLAIRKMRGELRLIRESDNERMGSINIGKTRISLRKFTLQEIENIYVKPADQPADDEDNGVPLKRYIDQNNFFTVLFSDPTIVYLEPERDAARHSGRMHESPIRYARIGLRPPACVQPANGSRKTVTANRDCRPAKSVRVRAPSSCRKLGHP